MHILGVRLSDFNSVCRLKRDFVAFDYEWTIDFFSHIAQKRLGNEFFYCKY